MKQIGRVLITMAAAAALMSFGMPSALAEAPTITSFSPTSGLVGTLVTIDGTNFVDVTAVKFKNTPAAFMVNSSTQITARVPTGAKTGRISVVTVNGTARSKEKFTVTAPVAPTITSFSPTSGPVGTVVTINGTNFVGTTSVAFNGTFATFTVNSSTQITAIVPAGATTGHISVITLSGSATSTANFTVT
jgi:large repetitive protein